MQSKRSAFVYISHSQNILFPYFVSLLGREGFAWQCGQLSSTEQVSNPDRSDVPPASIRSEYFSPSISVAHCAEGEPVKTGGQCRDSNLALSSDEGPTLERKLHATSGKFEFFTETGRGRRKHFTMFDDTLGRALMRHAIEPAEYSSLKRYALHWVAGGLQGHLASVDLNRIVAFDPHAALGTEKQVVHRQTYQAARSSIGTRPALVADQVACYDNSLTSVGQMLGYRSQARGRSRAIEILSDAGYRLGNFFSDLAKGH